MSKVTIDTIALMKREGKKIPVLTAYNCQMARILDIAGISVILVGDSVGMVESGYDTTLPVTVDELIYHTKAVTRGAPRPFIVTDMPFLSYQVSITDAKRNAGRIVKEGGAEAVKLEGGVTVADTIQAIVDMDIPVLGHVGLTPQSIHRTGGYRIRGKRGDEFESILRDAQSVEEAGAFALVVEAVPSALARAITEKLSIPVIGIGAGQWCDGQVLVLNDMLGLSEELEPKYVKRYANLDEIISSAVRGYIKDVSDGTFPDREHSY